jgi:glyoxylase I family protein
MNSAFLDSKPPLVTHPVRDLRQAALWYKEMLGFEIGPHEYGSFVEMFLDGKYIFHLTRAAEGMRPFPEPVFSFVSRDIEQTYESLRAKGVGVGKMSWYPDYSSFTLKDMEDNAIAVSQSFDIRVRKLEEQRLIGIRVLCRHDEYAVMIPQAAHKLRQRLGEIPNVIQAHTMIGVYKSECRHEAEEGYWVCVQVEHFTHIPDGMETLTIPPQSYAVKWHYGERHKVRETYHKLHGLMCESDLQRAPLAWRLELQRNWGRERENEVELDLYCPIT